MAVRDDFFNLEDVYVQKGNDRDKAYHMVCQQWIREGKYKELYDFFVAEVEGNYVEELDIYIDAFLKAGKKNLYKSYWEKILYKANSNFWCSFGYQKSNNKKLDTKTLLSYPMDVLEENHKQYPAYRDGYLEFIYNWRKTLLIIDKYTTAMQKINATEEIERAKILKESIYNLKKPKPKKTTDKRKMTETLFWELIEQSREEAKSNSEFLALLKDKLEAMSAVEIKKFQKILLEKIESLNHWDIWALAYIVREGCGDDAFDYFKAWIVSKGREAYENVKQMQIEKLQYLFDEDPQLETFMYVAQEAYSNKKYEEMPMPRVKTQKMQGKEWSEESICENYPKLCEMFASPRD